MPKSKNRRRAGKQQGQDVRPIKRSGRNEGQADYRTAQPLQQADQQQQQPMPERKCPYLDRVATLPDAFTADECADIINTALNDWDVREAQIQRDKDGKIEQNFIADVDYRETTLYIPPKPDEWLFSKLLGTIMTFNNNKEGYGFDVQGLAEPPNVMRYNEASMNESGIAGHYDWHIDVGPGEVPSMRKLSYSVLLNPAEYEGGELCLRVGRGEGPHPGQTGLEALGSMIMFPSYILHCVLPVTKGTRYAIVGWAHGPSFK